MSIDLAGKTIIITGASSGIGAVTALACAEAGMNLVLNARREDRLRELADRIQHEHQRTPALVVGDVTEPGLTARMLDTAQEQFDGYYAVFANAGYGLSITGLRMTDEQYRQIFDVNFFASVDLVTEAAHRLVDAEKPGHLLMCSSCVSKFSLPRHGAYAATKAAQESVCDSMRLELRPRNIYVSSVHPITTTTEFFEVAHERSGTDTRGRRSPAHSPGFFVQPPERVARAVIRCLRRPRPEVWTSHIVRIVCGVSTIFPRFGDAIVAKRARKDDDD